MSIRLLVAIQIAGAHTPAGTVVSLPPAMEADFVSGGRAEWVVRPSYPDTADLARHAEEHAELGNVVTTTLNEDTGMIENQSAGITYAAMGAIDVRMHGAKCDGLSVQDAVITSSGGSLYNVASASALFTQDDVGKSGAATARGSGRKYGYNFVVTAFVNPSNITINCSNAGIVSASSNIVWGSDDTSAVQAACDAAASMNSKGVVFFPVGITCVTAQITVADGVTLVGVGNLTGVDYSYMLKHAGSTLALVNYLAATHMLVAGTTGTAINGANIRGLNIDAQNLCGKSCDAPGRGCHFRETTFLRGTYSMGDFGPSSVVESCTFAGAEHSYSMRVTGDSRIESNYIFGAGSGYPTVYISGDDIWFSGNHLWRDADVDPVGDLIQITGWNGTSKGGAITIDTNQFDTAVGANINIIITGNTKIRCINILGNHSILNDQVETRPSAVINGTITGNTTLTVNSVTSGKVYLGATISGKRITAQSSGTIGGAGVYTIESSTNVGPVSMNCLGYPYISLNIEAGSTLRMLNVVGNTGHGSWNDVTKGLYSSFIDATGLLGSLLICNVTNNSIDNCGVPYGNIGTGFGKFVPTNSRDNYLLTNSASTTPVNF